MHSTLCSFGDSVRLCWPRIFPHTACYKPTPSRACDLSCRSPCRHINIFFLFHLWRMCSCCVCRVSVCVRAPVRLRVHVLCFLCVLTGEAVRGETDKTVKVEPNKSASAAVKKAATVAGQKAVKVTPLKAVESRSVRSKRRVKGEGKPAHVLSCFGIY